MYMKEQNNINSIGSGHFGTNPNRYDVSKSKKPSEDSFVQLGDLDIQAGHWWNDIQSLAQKSKEMDESFI